MSISLYQKYFDVLGKSYRNIVGIYDENELIVASTHEEVIGMYLHNLKVPYKTYVLGEEKQEHNVFIQGDEESSAVVAPVVIASLRAVKSLNREFDDKLFFMQQLINDKAENVAWKAQSLGIQDEECRVVFVIKVSSKHSLLVEQLIREVAPIKEKDFLFENKSDELVLVRRCKSEPNLSKLTSFAQQISSAIMSEVMEQVSIGIGSVSNSLATISKSYKAAMSALDIGYIFENKNRIYSFMNLGISRLITSVPIEKCKAFLHEVLHDDAMRELDSDTITTVQRFFDYDLNISLAARELYIHRNTLVYRLDRVQKQTGLDVRKFDDALLFKIALLIQRYLNGSRREGS